MLSKFQQSILNSESPATWNIKMGNKLHEMHEHMNNGSMHSNPTNFIIAPHNAVNKERADLVLTGVPADDLAAINQAITDLHTARASTDIAIRIDFLGGNIDVGTKTDGSAIVIPVGYDNIHMYGNGVKITGDVYDIFYENKYSILDSSGNNCILDGFDIDNSSVEYGLYNSGTNCTVSGNTCSSGGYGLSNTGTNCTITGNTCGSGGDYEYGLSNYGANCTITGNICSGNYSHGLYNEGGSCTITGNTCSSSGGAGLYCGTSDIVNKCIIIGNICIEAVISVEEGTCLPATQEAMADVNIGTITLRS